MSQPLNQFLIAVSEDPEQLEAYNRDPEAAMEAAGLSPEEKAAVRSGDMLPLWVEVHDGKETVRSPAALRSDTYTEPGAASPVEAGGDPAESAPRGPRIAHRYAHPDLPDLQQPGTLIVVGTGIQFVHHLTDEARYWLKKADQVVVVSSPTEVEWIKRLNPNTESLADCYQPGRPRLLAYEEMLKRIMTHLRRGITVCAAFYGHPGIFVHPSHQAIRQARREGFVARMLPGVSAEDCLFADIGFDPGQSGCQSYDATDFLVWSRRFDVNSALILWQISAVGQTGLQDVRLDRRGLRILIETLEPHYGREHPVVVYEAAQYAVADPVIQRLPLGRVPDARITTASTLYVPPKFGQVADRDMVKRLGLTLAEK